MKTQPINMAENAVQFAENGWKVYPLVKGGKVPHKGSNGHLEASNESEKVKELFLKYGNNSNIGISLIDTDIIILDVDIHTETVSGFDSVKELEDAYEQLPETYTVTTPRKGEHRYYRIPGLSLKKDFINFRPGIDILGTKVNAPPSRTDKGNYIVKSGEISEIAELPRWFVELMIQQDKQKQAETEFNAYPNPPQGKTWKAIILEEMVDGTCEGNRNVWLTSMFGKYIYSRMDVRKAIKLIEVVNDSFVQPPIDSKELERIINSVLKRETLKRKGVT